MGVSNEGMSYSLTIDKNEIKDDDVIIRLKAEIDIEKGYYIQSCDPELSLSPTSFEWFDSSVFINLGLMKEPKPELKYDKSLTHYKKALDIDNAESIITVISNIKCYIQTVHKSLRHG